MKNAVFLVCLLFLEFSVNVKCYTVKAVDEKNHNCTFILSDGDYEEFLETYPQFKICASQFDRTNLLIKLENYSLPAFPNGTFSNLPHLESFQLDISKSSDVQLLSPLLPEYVVFEDLKVESIVIYVSDALSLNGWKWNALSMKEYDRIKLFEFVAVRSKIIRLDSSFGEIAGGRVTIIRIIRCQLRWLGRYVFGPFSNLIILELRKNLIENFERFHLPEDSSKLQYIDLGYNKLKTLSWDLFKGVELQTLYLEGNNFKILDSELSTLAEISIRYVFGVLWPCDCNALSNISKNIENLWTEEDCYDGKLIKPIKDYCK